MVLGREIIKGLRPSIPEDMDPACKNMIQRCWHSNPRKRPTFCEIVDEFERMLGGRSFLHKQREVLAAARNRKQGMSIEKRVENFNLLHLKVDRSMVHRGDLLGKGSFAEVFSCRFTNWDCALKVFKPHLFNGNGPREQRFLRLIQVSG